MKALLITAIPALMLLSAVIGGTFYYRRSFAARLEDFAEGCRVIETMIENTSSPNAAEARGHLEMARVDLWNAREMRADGHKENAENALIRGYAQLRAARELIQRPETDEDE